MKRGLRRRAVAFALAAVLTLPALGAAGPLGPAPVAGAGLLEALWSWVTSLWSPIGPSIDPNGVGSNGDIGPYIDPDGASANSDIGPYIDPNG